MNDEIAETVRKLFAGACDFVAGVANLNQLPDATLPEIAFAGRSNVGKSSLINALTGRKALARISNTPGRTQQLNFFEIGGRFHLVDMPGYGYAQVSKQKKKDWDELIRDFLRGRSTLRSVMILIDSRHGLKDVDREFMKMLDETAVPYRIVLTKADKTSAEELKKITDEIEIALKKHAAAHPHAISTSSDQGAGIADLQIEIAGLTGVIAVR